MPNHRLKILLSLGMSAQRADLDKDLSYLVVVLRAALGAFPPVPVDSALYRECQASDPVLLTDVPVELPVPVL